MQLQLQLHCYNYTTLHHTTLLQYTRLDYTTLHLTTLNYIALRYITLHRPTLTTTTTTLLHSTLHLNHTTPHFPTLHYTTFITPPQIQLQLHYANFTNYTTTTIHNSTRLQLLLQLRYTTLHPAVVGEVTIATIATTPKDTTRTTFGSISEFALQSMHDSTNLFGHCLCGNTGTADCAHFMARSTGSPCRALQLFSRTPHSDAGHKPRDWLRSF